MYKNATPPLITKTENISSLQVDGQFKGNNAPFSWNEKYNGGVALNVTGRTVVDPDNPFFISLDEAPIFINYQEQPFNYIELTSTVNIIRPLAINFIPTTWIYVYANSPNPLIISPQTPGSSTFDSSNNYTLPAGSLSLVHIKPSVTSVRLSKGAAEDQNTSYTEVENDQITVSSIQLT